MNQQTLLAHIPHILNDKDRLLKASFIEPKKSQHFGSLRNTSSSLSFIVLSIEKKVSGQWKIKTTKKHTLLF